MNKKIKKELEAAFVAPKPERKQEFLRQFRKTGISTFEFLIIQFHYIKKWIIGLSVLMFGLVFVSSLYLQGDAVWIMAAFMPFLALSALTENTRSFVYGMEELEFATRFSLKAIVLARMGILAVFHFIVLLFLVFCLRQNGGIKLLEAGLYLLVPYCTSISIGLPLIRKLHNRESGYICIGIAVLVSGIVFLFQYQMQYMQAFQLTTVLTVILGFEIVLTISESVKLIKQTEELAWS